MSREEAIHRLARSLGYSVAMHSELQTALAHLPTDSLNDAVLLFQRSKWDLDGVMMRRLVLQRANGDYRIELLKRLTDINAELLNPWNIKSFFGETKGIEAYSVEDVTEDHTVWAAVAMLVSYGTYSMHFGQDLGVLREPVDAAQNMIDVSPVEHMSLIREIILTRRVYKVDEIETLCTGGAPLYEGAL